MRPKGFINFYFFFSSFFLVRRRFTITNPHQPFTLYLHRRADLISSRQQTTSSSSSSSLDISPLPLSLTSCQTLHQEQVTHTCSQSRVRYLLAAFSWISFPEDSVNNPLDFPPHWIIWTFSFSQLQGHAFLRVFLSFLSFPAYQIDGSQNGERIQVLWHLRGMFWSILATWSEQDLCFFYQ